VKLKTTLLLLAVFAGLLAVVLYFDSRGKKTAADKEETNTLIRLASEDVRKASLVRGPETLTFEKDEAGRGG